MIGRYLLEPQGGEGDGTGTATTDQGEARGPDLSKAAAGLVAKHGSHDAALLVLLGENFREREEKRELKARVPGPDAVVLVGDDAKHWSHYRDLGRPSDLKAALAERDTYKAEAGTFRKAETHRSAAELHGFRPGVLGTLAKDLEIDFEEQRGKDGKPVKVAFVRGEGDAKTPLTEYAETHWADFLPSLKLEAEKAPRVGTPAVQRPRTVPAGGGSPEKRRPTSSL